MNWRTEWDENDYEAMMNRVWKSASSLPRKTEWWEWLLRVSNDANNKLMNTLLSDWKLSELEPISDSRIQDFVCKDENSIISWSWDKVMSISAWKEVKKIDIVWAGSKRMRIILHDWVEELNIRWLWDKYLQIISTNPGLKLEVAWKWDKYVQVITNNSNLKVNARWAWKQNISINSLDDFLDSSK